MNLKKCANYQILEQNTVPPDLRPACAGMSLDNKYR